MTILSILAAGCAAANIWLGAVVLAASPAYTLYRQYTIRRDRKTLGALMDKALAA